MSRKQRSLFDSVGDAASDAGSEALAAISNLGGGDAGGTVGRIVSAVFGRHGGFAPKVITSVTKHGIAGIQRVEPLEGVDRGYRAVAADANGLESIRTIIELDPREYEVTVTREEGAGVVEFVQAPEPEPEQAVEPKPPVKQSGAIPADGGERAQSAAGREQSVETTPVEQGAQPIGQSAHRDSAVAQARAEAEKAKAEAEAEKARAEAETARAEAEAAKARARAERARANAEADAVDADSGGTPELDGGTTLSGAQSAPATATPSGQAQPGVQHASVDGAIDAGDVDPAFSGLTGAPAGDESAALDPAFATGADAPLKTDEPLEAETVRGESSDEGTTVVDDGFGSDDEFGSFVTASPVEESASETDDVPEETGGFEF